jgi:hypothetical protein
LKKKYPLSLGSAVEEVTSSQWRCHASERN